MDHIVTIANGRFNPWMLSIPAGDTVIFANLGPIEPAHTVVSKDGKWDTGIIVPGAHSRPVEFPNPGQFLYHCGDQPLIKGVIEVNPES